MITSVNPYMELSSFKKYCHLASILLILLSLNPAAATQVMPPVPESWPEYFQPTYVERRIHATCAATSLALRWNFSQKGLEVTSLVFDKRHASRAELVKINLWLRDIGGDALVRVECDSASATLTFFQSQLVGTASSVQTRILWRNDRAEIIRRL